MKLVEFVTGRRIKLNRVIYIDPDIRVTMKLELGKDILDYDVNCVVGIFDMKDRTDENELDLVTQELVATLKEIFQEADEQGQRTLLLSATINTLLRHEGMTLADLRDFMNDDKNLELIKL